MADTRNKSQGGRAATSTGNPPLTKRGLSRKRREQQRQRRILLVAGAALGLALLIVLAGVIYDQVWLPGRPVAQVNNETLTTREYWRERRLAYAQEVYQNLQLLALFGANQQISGQFANQSPAIDQQVNNIRTAPVDPQVVNSWIEEQLLRNGARDMGIEISDEQVTQVMAMELGAVFAPPPTEPLTPTAALTPTAELTPTEVLSPTVAPGDDDEASEQEPAADARASPEPAASPTMAPTPTPAPTPGPEAAAEEVERAIDTLYQLYTNEINQFNTAAQPALSREDFQQALRDNFRQQGYTERIRQELVPEEEFEASGEPTRVQARQIFIEVPVADDAGEAERDEAFAEARAEAEEVLEQLEDGAVFGELASEFSDDPGSREQGGDLGFFNPEGIADNGATYPPALVDAAFALEEGAISAPIRSRFGWHIIEVLNREVPTTEEQLREARTEAFNEWLEERREEASIQRFPEPTPTPETPTAEPVPTTAPTFLPGPPTAVPTPTLEPTVEPDEVEESAPTATP
jgi:parvulin-like peptidyl-prolyl isomerase